jgi:hypothetical protein
VSAGPPVVFLGPTLPVATAKKLADAIFLPPASQGSVIACVNRYAPSCILIIDGVFQSVPAVRHKEILWAIAGGTPVAGAASMGALRAAELRPHMMGIGLAYRWYRRFQFAPDDAVAVLHGPQEVGCPPLSVAEIDLRMTIRALQRTAAIGSAEATLLRAAVRRLNFRERTIERVVAEAGLDGRRQAVLQLAVACGLKLAGQKEIDARRALFLLREGKIRSSPHDFVAKLTSPLAADLVQAKDMPWLGIQPYD